MTRHDAEKLMKISRARTVIDLWRLSPKSERDTKDVIAALTEYHGACLRYTGGAYELRMLGLCGTATSGHALMIESWDRAAAKWIASRMAEKQHV